MDIAEISVRRPVATWMRILIFMICGAIAFTQLAIELLPDISRPTLYVVTSWPGVSPEDLETQITRPVEDAVATVAGLVRLSSTTSEGNSRVVLEFAPDYDINQAALDVLQIVQRAQRRFPVDPQLQPPTVQRFDPNNLPVLVLGVSGVDDPVRLRTILENEVKPILESAEGVASADVNGGLERAIMIYFDPHRLLARSLTSQDLVRALSNENQNVPAGLVNQGNQQLLVRSYGWITSPSQLWNIPVGRSNQRLIPLREVARVVDGHEDPPSTIQRLNGEPAASLNIVKQSNANTIDTVQAVLEKLEEVKANHPELEFREVYNQSSFVQEAVHSLEEAAVIGGSLAMLIVFFFLRNVRSTLVVATSIPVSVISTFGFIYLWGFSLNTMSLVGLALATGLIVDDAVVVMEAIYRRMEEQNLPPDEAAIQGTRPIVSAVVSSTLTIMVVFVPLLLIPGRTGQMFKQFAVVVIVAMAFSLLDALTGVPMLCSQFIRRNDNPTGWRARFYERSGRWLEALDSGYRNLLSRALGRRFAALAAAFGLTVLSFGLVPFIPYEFMPGTDTNTLRMQLAMPRGSAMEETDAAMRSIEGQLAKSKDVVSYLTTVGQATGSTGGRDTGSAWIALRSSRKASSDQIARRLGAAFRDIPGVRAYPSTMDIVRTQLSGGNQGQSLELDIFGPELDELARLSTEFIDRLKGIPGLEDIRDRAGDPAPEVRWIVDRQKATQLGLSFSTVAQALQTASEGSQAGYLQTGGTRPPIIVQVAPEARNTVENLSELVVNSSVASTVQNASPGSIANAPRGVQLGQVASPEQATGYASINRDTRQRYASLVSAAQTRPLSDVQRDVQEALQGVQMPPGYHWAWSSQMQEQQQEFGRLGFISVLAVVLIYMLLCIQFESLIIPLSIMMCVPLCFIGIFLALFLSGTSFSVMAGVGCLMLIGIAVKNGILLVENTEQARERGLKREEALLEACPTRLRPILITALAAMLGMVPIALRGRGGELEAPMAISVIGGLFASTVLTLFVVPTAYLLFDDLEKRLFKGKHKHHE